MLFHLCEFQQAAEIRLSLFVLRLDHAAHQFQVVAAIHARVPVRRDAEGETLCAQPADLPSGLLIAGQGAQFFSSKEEAHVQTQRLFIISSLGLAVSLCTTLGMLCIQLGAVVDGVEFAPL